MSIDVCYVFNKICFIKTKYPPPPKKKNSKQKNKNTKEKNLIKQALVLPSMQSHAAYVWRQIYLSLLIRRGVNVLKRIRHVLLEEISIRERLKVSVLGSRIWISFHFIHSD